MKTKKEQKQTGTKERSSERKKNKKKVKRKMINGKEEKLKK